MAKELVQQRIQRLREAAGYDRHRLSELTGLSYTAVWNWETKGTETSFVPEENSLKKVAEALGTTVEYLKTGEGEPDSDTDSRQALNIQQVLEGLRELEKLPEVRAYSALLKSLKNVA